MSSADEEFRDDFAKRLGGGGGGRRSASKAPPSGRSKSNSRASRRKTLDPSVLPGSRGQPVPQVSEVGCGCKTWNKIGLGIELGNNSTSTSESARKSQSGDKSPVSSTSICNRKLAKSVSGMFFRRVKSAPPAASASPKFEEQWSSFREQHLQEMNEMKQMYSALQSMCQEIKTITGLSPAAVSPSAAAERTPTPTATTQPRRASPQTQSPPEAHDRSTPRTMRPVRQVTGSERKPAPTQPAATITPRRARSAPRTRSAAHHHSSRPPSRDLSSGVNLFFRSPWTDITAALFEEIVQVQKTFLRGFCQSLAKEAPGADAVGALVARLLPHTAFAKPWHVKYAVEAWVNRVVLGDFGTEGYGVPNTTDTTDTEAGSQHPWEEYQKLALLAPSDAIDPEGGRYHPRFHELCNRKFQAVHDVLGWWDEWPAAVVEEFLEAMKHVWRAHRLAFAFDAPAAIFCVKTSTAFDAEYMESVLEASQFDFSSQVGFMVTPGFLVHGLVVKSQVYLMPSAAL